MKGNHKNLAAKAVPSFLLPAIETLARTDTPQHVAQHFHSATYQ